MGDSSCMTHLLPPYTAFLAGRGLWRCSCEGWDFCAGAHVHCLLTAGGSGLCMPARTRPPVLRQCGESCSPRRAQRTRHALSCPQHSANIYTQMHAYVRACTRTSTPQSLTDLHHACMHVEHASTENAHTQANTPLHPTHPQAAPRCPPIGRRWGPRALCPRRWRAQISKSSKSEPERPGAGA